MLTDFSNSLTAAFLNELQKNKLPYLKSVAALPYEN